MAYGTMSIGNAGFTKKFISTLFLLMHPKGSLFHSNDPTSPAELYGGTWERIEGKFIMGASDTYPAGSTGGSVTISIKQTNLPDVRIPIQTIRPGGFTGSVYDTITTSGSSDGSVDTFSRTGRTDPLGNGTPLNILPPYYSVHIWRRVA